MEKNFLIPALMAAESEINLILDELNKQFHNEILELLQQSDERWIERVFTFVFQKDGETKNIDNYITESHLNAAKKARFFFLLKGLNTKKELKKIVEAKTNHCLVQMMNQLTPEDKVLLQTLTKINNNHRNE